MPQTYAILWAPPAKDRGAESELVRRLGPEAADDRDGARLSVKALEPSEAAEVAVAPEVFAIADAMPTQLIEPLAASNGDNGDVAWGIGAVGASGCQFSGAGVRVAVLDTGILRDHPAFAGVDITERDFSGSGSGDRQGHGTHCAGTIFGRPVGGVRIGVAPGVTNALIGKVLGDDGRGMNTMTFAALLWAIQSGANIISMSLGLNFAKQVNDLVRDGWPLDLATSRSLETYRRTLKMYEAIMGVQRTPGIGLVGLAR